MTLSILGIIICVYSTAAAVDNNDPSPINIGMIKISISVRPTFVVLITDLLPVHGVLSILIDAMCCWSRVLIVGLQI